MKVPGVVAHAFNLSTWEAEAGRSLRVQGQPGLYRELQDNQGRGKTLSQMKRVNVMVNRVKGR